MTWLTFLLYRKQYQQILTLVANRYLFHYNDNSHQIASVIEESFPKDLQSNFQVKSARHKLSSLRFSILLFMYNLFFPVFSSLYCCNYRPWFILAKVIRIQAGSISRYRRRKKSDESQDLMSYNNEVKLT